MKAELIATDDSRWSAFIQRTTHDFYHLPGYASLSARHDLADAFALLVTDGERSMILPLLLRSIPGSRVDATSPYGYPGPLVSGTDEPEFMNEALEMGMDVLRSSGIVSLFVRLHPILNPVLPETSGQVVRHGSTVSVDLTSPSDRLWREMRDNHRRDISRAVEAGRRAYFDDAWAHFATFKRLYRSTMDRLDAQTQYRFSDAYFDQLRSALGESLRLCVVEAAGSIIGAGLFVETCGIVQYHLSGTDSAFKHEQPTKLMFHFVRGWAQDRGDTRLHLGGGVGGADDSLYRFKAGFSPDRHGFHTLRAVLDHAEYRRLDALAGETPIAQGFFPSYRRLSP